ncbi:MAG: hypothetical protein B7Y80_20810 [Hyphomicrobium sp. 32-62-53]|nr:MAG: hypothetical protein B7Z29_20765 [Hyphomicrobium sp. 12-62-95]OYX97128.1 MAG: hypothetical protein B7Y80_20810 [Hyphomicrobium sp. 32-62-53]
MAAEMGYAVGVLASIFRCFERAYGARVASPAGADRLRGSRAGRGRDLFSCGKAKERWGGCNLQFVVNKVLIRPTQSLVLVTD